MASAWYVVHSKPHKETELWQHLLARGFETFFPHFRVQPVNPRSRKVRPYFPRYLFVRADLEAEGLSKFQWMPGAIGLVCFGGLPASVPDDLILAVEDHLQQINQAGGEQLHQLKPGMLVTIEDGPFEGYEAIFDTRLNGKDRVRVLLKMLNNGRLPMELRAGQIKPVNSGT